MTDPGFDPTVVKAQGIAYLQRPADFLDHGDIGPEGKNGEVAVVPLSIFAQGEAGQQEFHLSLFFGRLGKPFRHTIGTDKVAITILAFHEFPFHGEFMVVFQFVAALFHEIVQPAPGFIVFCDPGKDRKSRIVLEILKLHSTQEKAESGAVITFLHGFHCFENLKGREGFKGGF